jgi:hypothetical protein
MKDTKGPNTLLGSMERVVGTPGCTPVALNEVGDKQRGRHVLDDCLGQQRRQEEQLHG